MSSETQQRVDPAEYTEDYYLGDCEGFAVFQESGGEELSARLRRALRLAGLRPGQRVLDIACGRGEVVLHAARRGTDAYGIDYSEAAARLSYGTLTASERERSLRAAAARMDATNLAFATGSFDTILMLDFVEHVYPAELERAFDEALRVLKPSGRLIIHTSPNRDFERIIYAHYVRHVHSVILKVTKRLGIQDRLLNPLMLPTSPTVPHSDYDYRLHVNEQTAGNLHRLLKQRGFGRITVGHWEPPQRRIYTELRESIELKVLDFIRYLRPISRLWPLNRYFSNHIWITAQRPATGN